MQDTQFIPIDKRQSLLVFIIIAVSMALRLLIVLERCTEHTLRLPRRDHLPCLDVAMANVEYGLLSLFVVYTGT